MSTRRIRSTAPLSSARLIDVNDLPIGLIDIELSMPPTELVGDTAVFLLRPEQGPPAAVLKVARGLLGAAELRTQRRVLAELAIHPATRRRMARTAAADPGLRRARRCDRVRGVLSAGNRPGGGAGAPPEPCRGADRCGPERHRTAAPADCHVRRRRQRLLVDGDGSSNHWRA